MFMSWKFLTILFIAGLIRENFGFIHQQDTSYDVVPSSKKFNLDLENDSQPPKGLQIAKGLGQARFKFLKNAKNLKMRLANKRNNLKGLLPSQRDRQSPPEALNKFNAGNNKNINGFDDVMESSKNNYFYQYPDMVGDRFNNNDNLNRNRMWTNLERSSEEEEENIFSPKIHKYSPTSAVRHNRPDSNNDNFRKNWWENQDASHAVNPSSHFHNNEYHDTLQSRHYYNDDENYNSNSNINSLEMNSFENRKSNGDKFSKSNQQLKSAFGVEEDDGDIFEQIRKAATAANAKELKRNGRQNRMESSDYNDDKSFYRISEENAKRNSDRLSYRTISAPTYNFQNAEPFVWYGFEGDKPYPLGSINQQYRVPENFQSMESNSEIVGDDKKKLKKLKKLKKHKLNKLRSWTDSDNMEHLHEDNRNVHPVIMQEYVQSMHGHSNVPSSTSYKSNFLTSQSEPLKIEMFDNDSKLLAVQKSANDNETQEDNLNQKNQEGQLEHLNNLNNEDMIMAKAISLAAMKLAKIEERLENENQQRMKAEQQTGKEVWKTNEDRVMQPSDPRIVMMTLKAKELDKMQNDENMIRDDPILTRYLVTDESKEWTNTRALTENSKKGDSNKKLNDKSKLSNDVSKMFMRNSPDDKNTVTSQHQINIPHSGITVFEPTRIMHYHSSGPPVELANSGKIPVFEEPQTIIKVNTVSDVDQQKSLPETQRSMPLQTNDGSKMYAMQFGYNLNNPQIPVFYHQPAYRWPVVNTEPLTYTYNGVQYKFVNPAIPNNSNDPVLMSIGPQIPAHSSLLRPGNLFGLTRYNSGYGGPFGRLSYYQALLNKQQQQRIEPDYNYYDYDNDASNKIETFVAPEKKTPNLENSEDVHYITKRDVQQPHHDHQRHKRSTETETCPCFKYPFHGPRRFDPAYQSSAMSPYRSDYRSYMNYPRYQTPEQSDPMVGTTFTKVLSKPYLGLWNPDHHFRKPWLRSHGQFLHPFDNNFRNGHRFRRNDNEMSFYSNRNLLNNAELNILGNDGLFYNYYGPDY